MYRSHDTTTFERLPLLLKVYPNGQLEGNNMLHKNYKYKKYINFYIQIPLIRFYRHFSLQIPCDIANNIFCSDLKNFHKLRFKLTRLYKNSKAFRNLSLFQNKTVIANSSIAKTLLYKKIHLVGLQAISSKREHFLLTILCVHRLNLHWFHAPDWAEETYIGWTRMHTSFNYSSKICSRKLNISVIILQ